MRWLIVFTALFAACVQFGWWGVATVFGCAWVMQMVQFWIHAIVEKDGHE
jgi:hypothetical protein